MEWAAAYEKVWKKIGIVAGVYLIVKYLVPPTVPFLVAALAAWWLRPLFVWLEKRLRIRPGISAVLLLVVSLAAGGWLFYYLGGQMVRFCGDFFTGFGVEEALWDCCQAAERLLGIPADRVDRVVRTQVEALSGQMEGSVILHAFDGSFAAMKGIGSVGIFLVVTAIAFLLLSADFEKIKEEASEAVLFTRLVKLGRSIKEAIGSYVKAQCIIVGIIVALCITGFFLLGSPYALLLGIGTGLLDALPVLGTSLVIVPWLLLEVLRGQYGNAVILGLTYGACVLTREILEPKLVGKQLGLFPVLVLLSVYVGVSVYGAGGIVLGPLSLLVIRELWKEV